MSNKYKSTRFMTSSEKKIKKKDGIIRTLVFLLCISLIANGYLVNLLFDKGVIGVDQVSENIVNKVIAPNESNNIISDKINEVFDVGNNSKDSSKKLGGYIQDKSEIYDYVFDELLEGKTTIELMFPSDAITFDDFYEEYTRILNDHPELFWLNGGASGNGIAYQNLVTYKFELGTTCDLSNIVTMKDEMDIVVNRIVTEAKKYDSDMDRVQFVHDTLVRECDYDFDAYNTTMTKGYEYTDHIAYSPYGCLVRKKSVCNGYATAFQIIMHQLGIECGKINGVGYSSMGAGPHAWNYVNIGGKYYYIDVTWDDPVYADNSYKSDEVRQDYFCISLEQMSKDHVADEGQTLPQ